MLNALLRRRRRKKSGENNNNVQTYSESNEILCEKECFITLKMNCFRFGNERKHADCSKWNDSRNRWSEEPKIHTTCKEVESKKIYNNN